MVTHNGVFSPEMGEKMREEKGGVSQEVLPSS